MQIIGYRPERGWAHNKARSIARETHNYFLKMGREHGLVRHGINSYALLSEPTPCESEELAGKAGILQGYRLWHGSAINAGDVSHTIYWQVPENVEPHLGYCPPNQYLIDVVRNW